MITGPGRPNIPHTPQQPAGVKLPAAAVTPEVARVAIQAQYSYSRLGLLVGVLCILGGLVLLLHGVAGSVSWTTKLLGLESTLSDAAPGALLFIVGSFVVFLTRYEVESTT